MRKVFIVLKQELSNTFKRPSYLIFAFGIPILAVLILVGFQLFNEDSAGNTNSDNAPSTEWEMMTEGYVDQSGLIDMIPPDLPEGKLISYQNESRASQALESGEISAYYIIPPDYIERGGILYVYPNSRSFLSDGQDWVMKWTLIVNLLDGDVEAANKVWNPIWEFEERNLSFLSDSSASSDESCMRPGSTCASNDLIRLMPSMMAALFFMVFMASSNMLFNSVGTEKENRTMEVLMLSIHPRQMLAAKLAASGIAGVAQTICWLAAIFFMFNRGGTTLSLPDGFVFPTNIVFWSLVYFVGGYLLFGSLMAGAGALVPRMKEAGIANFIALSPLFLGYIVGLLAPLANAANGLFPLVLSYIPLTSPIVMIMRLTNGVVPLWHLLFSVAFLYLSAYYALHFAASLFQAQNLLSGQSFSLKRYFKAFAGRTYA